MYIFISLCSALISFILYFGNNNSTAKTAHLSDTTGVKLFVLGTVQDGGSPHIGCTKVCCKHLFEHPDPLRKVVSLGLIDFDNRKKILFEATPDIAAQLKILHRYGQGTGTEMPEAIFLTHAHIGHYAGLMHLGKEAADTKSIPVYAMPRMKIFLEQNGPWQQLVSRNNIQLRLLTENNTTKVSPAVEVIPVTVPHRDEYSETVGYIISGPSKKVLFIPDIDKWSKWKKNIVDEIKKVDYAFIDATFFGSAEINNRSIAEIPHPLVSESMQLFSALDVKEKNKIWFIHFNHTNPLLRADSPETKEVLQNGFHVAVMGDVFVL